MKIKQVLKTILITYCLLCAALTTIDLVNLSIFGFDYITQSCETLLNHIDGVDND